VGYRIVLGVGIHGGIPLGVGISRRAVDENVDGLKIVTKGGN
jgi:hypothetical protein